MKRKHISGQDFTLQKKETANELKKKRKKLFGEIRATLLVVFAAAVLGYALITFGFQTMRVQGSSMEPALSAGDTVLVSKLSYLFGSVKRGDIVAIRAMGSDSYFDIKRVIGIPGDKISIMGGRILVNEEPLDPAYDPGTVQSPGRLSTPVTLGEKEYFVIGDNISSSEDSRFSTYGNVQQSEIRGKVFYRLTKGKRGRIVNPAETKTEEQTEDPAKEPTETQSEE